MSTNTTRKLFGTDGIRGIAGEPPLDPTTIFAAGLALGHSLRKATSAARVLLGRDTRESSPWIAATFAAGLRDAGTQVESAGSRSHARGRLSRAHARVSRRRRYLRVAQSLARQRHQAVRRRRIQTAGCRRARNRRRDPPSRCACRGADASPPSVEDNATLQGDYIQFLLDAVPGLSLQGLRIVADCANGAAAAIAPELFRRLGGDVTLAQHRTRRPQHQ